MTELQHELSKVVEFVTERTGWRDVPGGGKVPIVEKLAQPYFRYYCSCGLIGGKRATHDAALAGFEEHKTR